MAITGRKVVKFILVCIWKQENEQYLHIEMYIGDRSYTSKSYVNSHNGFHLTVKLIYDTIVYIITCLLCFKGRYSFHYQMTSFLITTYYSVVKQYSLPCLNL